MAELFLHIGVSLDGYIEDAQGDIEWLTSDTTFDDYSTTMLQSIDGMIFGRKAHGLLAQFWPTAAESADATPDLKAQTRLMNALPKYVLTHGTERTGWVNSHAITVSDVPGLTAKATRPIAVFAGASTAQALLEARLLHDLRVIQYPILLGGGTPLFARDGIRRPLTLVGTQHFPSGATLLRYRVND